MTGGMLTDLIQHCNLAHRLNFSTAIILLSLVNHCWDICRSVHSITELWRPCFASICCETCFARLDLSQFYHMLSILSYVVNEQQ